MDAILTAIGGMIGKVSDPVTIVLLLLLAGSEWMRITEGRENRKDRNEALIPAMKEITEALNDIKNAISAITGKAL